MNVLLIEKMTFFYINNLSKAPLRSDGTVVKIFHLFSLVHHQHLLIEILPAGVLPPAPPKLFT